MSSVNERRRVEEAVNALDGQAVRVPLPDRDAERTFRDHLTRVVDIALEKSDLLADPDLPLIEAYERELERVRRQFTHRLRRLTGQHYETVADAYLRGERDDWIGALAVYYRQCYCRLQERYTLNNRILSSIVIRYSDSFTVNLRFVDGDVTPEAVRYESSTLGETDLDDAYRGQYHDDCQYSQREAAEYIRENVDHVRAVAPDPDAAAETDRYGGYVHLTGRHGSVFSEYFGPVDPDPRRFDGPAAEPQLVPEGAEAERVTRELFADPTS